MQKFGPAYSIILYTIFTHFGYSIALIFTSYDELIKVLSNNRHLYIEYLPRVMSISYLAILAFIIGWHTDKFIVMKNKSKRLRTDISSNHKSTYVKVSTVVVYLYFAILIYYALSYGIIGQSYIIVKEVFASQFLSYLQRLFWVATVPLVIFAKKRDFLINAAPLTGIFAILMLTGNRNDILIPLVVGFSVFTLKNRKLLKVPLIIGLFTVFILNPLISEIRQAGIFTINSISNGIEAALLEMGLQVNPFSIIMYLTENGVNPMRGLTILLPSFAILNLNFLYTTNDFLSSMYNVQRLLENQNHLGQAFSMIGEMWINFGVLGAVLVYFAFGKFSRKMEKKITTDYDLLIYGQIALIMMYWVRNLILFNIILVIFSIALHYFTKKLAVKRKTR
jgi:oligosaccharide repeat unit polymerase